MAGALTCRPTQTLVAVEGGSMRKKSGQTEKICVEI